MPDVTILLQRTIGQGNRMLMEDRVVLRPAALQPSKIVSYLRKTLSERETREVQFIFLQIHCNHL